MSKSLNVQLMIIDPQNDFMGNADGTPYSAGGQTAQLPVPGATDDMDRVAALVGRIGHKLSDIHVTLDSHRPIDVAHAAFWKDSTGKHPAPFTVISHDDVKNGAWAPRDPGLRDRMLGYTQALADGGQYMLTVWPTHCLIGSWGHTLYEPLAAALRTWEEREFASIDYLTKGTNVLTEHYGGLKAEVEDPDDPSTGLNVGFLEILQQADIVAIAGEASSHCVKATIQQVVDNIGDEHLPKIHLLTDGMSPVPAIPGVIDFPAIAGQFLNDMERRGLKLTTTVDFLS